MQSRFKQALAGDNRVSDVRGHGLMLGIELAEPPERFVERALEARSFLMSPRERSFACSRPSF